MQGRQITTDDLEEMGQCFCQALGQLKSCLAAHTSGSGGERGGREGEGEGREEEEEEEKLISNSSATERSVCLASYE